MTDGKIDVLSMLDAYGALARSLSQVGESQLVPRNSKWHGIRACLEALSGPTVKRSGFTIIPSAEDRAVHAAIGRYHSGDDRRLGAAQYTGEPE